MRLNVTLTNTKTGTSWSFTPHKHSSVMTNVVMRLKDNQEQLIVLTNVQAHRYVQSFRERGFV